MGEPRRSVPRLAADLLRWDQWVKNVFVFGPLVFGKALMRPEKVGPALVAFGLFCVITSATYIHNDITDLTSDRAHPRKRHRPIASGEVSPRTARAVSVMLLVLGFGAAMLLLPRVLPWLVAYAIINVLYSGFLKPLVLLDVMAIAVGFVMRVQVGSLAVRIDASPWILLCTFVLALFLALGKRRHELLEAEGDGSPRAVNGRAVYGADFLEQAMGIVSAVAIVCYAVFTTSEKAQDIHGTGKLVYTVPFVVYGLLRYQWLLHDDGRGGDPGDIVSTDRPLQVAIVAWALTWLLLLYWR